jgi:hypothetical protein
MMSLALPPSPRRRRGISLVEFVGCLSAMIGGIVLGSMYLGVDVKEMTFSALERARVIEPRLKKSRPQPAAEETPPKPASDERDQESAAPAEPEAQGADEPAAAEPAEPPRAPSEAPASDAEPAEPAPAQDALPTVGFFAREDLITPQQREALTRAYWDALAACMEQEVEQRTPAIDADGNWQLFDYLTSRKTGHQKAAEAIVQLDPRGVDDHVMQYAKTARAWHEDGAKLFGRAVDLLTDAPTAQLSGPFAQSWQSAATQHRMEARLLAEKHEAVQSYLAHAYETPAEESAEPAQ